MLLEINGRETALEPSLKTVGDLLGFVDQQVAASGEIVTAVRLDGVDETAFRASALHTRALAPIRSIAIESDTPKGLARRCLGEASQELDALAGAAREASRCFRDGRPDDGRRQLSDLTHNIMGLVRLVATARPALVGEFESAGQDGSSIRMLTADLDRLVGDLTAGQQDEDWVLVADLLQYDLAPLLLRWRTTLIEIVAG